MIRAVHCIAVTLFCLIANAGCAARPGVEPVDRVTIFVPGVFGDGGWYDGLIDELNQSAGPVDVMTWGAPKAAFAANFSDPKIHADAETKLAAKLDALPPNVRANLVGHSAGCGVILGALSRVNRNVEHVVIIAPSVSPTYDLSPAVRRAACGIDVFYSDKDTTFLKWRTGNFGTYDGIKTPAAGYAGFTKTTAHVRQHPYDPNWKSLGNDGGHGGGVARAFVREVISPLLRQRDEPR